MNHRKLSMFIVLLMSFSLISLTVRQDAPTGLLKGDIAPDFEGRDISGKKVSLSRMLKSGPVVLVFYRGQWCPHCNRYLKQLEDSLSMIRGKGASVIAISPETNDGIKQTLEKTKASFPVVHDEGKKIMDLYKVNYKVSDATKENYMKYGIDFDKANGDNGSYLPVPATYVISKDAKISYAFFNPDFKKRATVKEILDHL